MKIIVDSREQQPWEFLNAEVRTLRTGDYSLDGLEDILSIERKKTTGELCTNLGREKKRFEDEMERMSTFSYAFILLEFDLDTLLRFPKGSGIPQSKWRRVRVSGNYMLSLLQTYEIKYGVNVKFCGDRDNAQVIAKNIFKKVLKYHLPK